MKKNERIKRMQKLKRELTCSSSHKKWLENFWKKNPNYIPPLVYQPERSKREDSLVVTSGGVPMPWKFKSNMLKRCGALNSMET